MFLILIVWAITIALPIVGSLTFWPVRHGYDFYIPIILAVAGFFIGVFFIFILASICSLPMKRKNKEWTKVSKWSTFWIKQGMTFINHHALVICKLVGKEKMPKNGRFLLVCNHRSNFDPMLVTEKLGKYEIGWITKRSNYKVPIARNLMPSIFYQPIDRDDPLQSLQVMKNSIDLINKGITSIGVFPEGRRANDGLLTNFHEGVFNIAIKAHCPIVIVTVKGTERISGRYPWKFTKVRMEVVRVLQPEEFETQPAKTVSDNVHAIMLENLSK